MSEPGTSPNVSAQGVLNVGDHVAYTPTSDELSLEAGIRAAADAVTKAGTHGAQKLAFESLKTLHALRSPEMVAFLERQRGIG